MVSIGMAYIVMANIVMAYLVRAHTDGVCIVIAQMCHASMYQTYLAGWRVCCHLCCHAFVHGSQVYLVSLLWPV